MKKISKRQLRRIIREEADIIINYDSADEIDAREDAWDGGENLSLPIDHSKAGGGEEVHAEPEHLPDADPVLNNESLRTLYVYRGKNDLGRSYVMPRKIYEQYYDAYAFGRTDTAQGILEEHLDVCFPSWGNYEWK